MDYIILGSKGVVGSELSSYLALKERVIKGEDKFSQYHKVGPANIRSFLLAYHEPVIYHFAQMSRVPLSIQYPYTTVKNNIMSLLNVLEGMRITNNKGKLIFISSREVYGKVYSGNKPIEVGYRRQALNPYAASKIASEAIVESYIETYDIDARIVRLSSVYGSIHDHPTRLIPRLILNALVKKKIKTFSDGKKTFDFVYIDDVTNALYRLGQPHDGFMIYNHITTGIPTTINKLCEIIAQETKATIEYNESPERTYPDQEFFVGETDGLKGIIGEWNPIPVEDGIKKTIEKYKKLSKNELNEAYQITKNNNYTKIVRDSGLTPELFM